MKQGERLIKQQRKAVGGDLTKFDERYLADLDRLQKQFRPHGVKLRLMEYMIEFEKELYGQL